MKTSSVYGTFKCLSRMKIRNTLLENFLAALLTITKQSSARHCYSSVKTRYNKTNQKLLNYSLGVEALKFGEGEDFFISAEHLAARFADPFFKNYSLIWFDQQTKTNLAALFIFDAIKKCRVTDLYSF